MQYSLMEVLMLTLFSMTVVFLVLLGLMVLMMVSAKFFGAKEPEPLSTPERVKNNALFQTDPLAKVAAITALAQASEGASGKTFKIKQIEKMD